jgi:hypothetical protein
LLEKIEAGEPVIAPEDAEKLRQTERDLTEPLPRSATQWVAVVFWRNRDTLHLSDNAAQPPAGRRTPAVQAPQVRDALG